MNNDDLYEQVRAGGEFDSSGTFSFDLEAARRKSAAHRLANEDVWLAGPTMIAAGLGASKLMVMHSYRDFTPEVIFRFDGAPVPSTWPGEIAAGRDPGDHPSAQALLSTFNLGVAAGVKRMSVDTFSPDLHESKLRKMMVGSRAWSDLRVVLAAHIVPMSRSHRVMERCKYAPMEVSLNAHNFSPPQKIPGALAARVVRGGDLTRLRVTFPKAPVVEEGGEYNAVFWLPQDEVPKDRFTIVLNRVSSADDVPKERFTIVLNGVSFPGDARELLGSHVQCVASVSHLVPDLSMEKIVRDEEFGRWTHWVRDQCAQFLVQLGAVVPHELSVAQRLVTCLDGALHDPQFPAARQPALLAAMTRLLAHCADWRFADRVARDLASRVAQCEPSAGAQCEPSTVESLVCTLGAIGRFEEASRLCGTVAEASRRARLLALLGRAEGRASGLQDDEAIEVVACRLAEGDWKAAVEAAGQVSDESPAVRVRRLDLLAQALTLGGRLDEAIAAVEQAAAVALEGDECDLAALWRRLRNLRGDGLGLGDGALQAARAWVASFSRSPTLEAQLRDRSRLACQPRALQEGDRLSHAGDWEGALNRWLSALERREETDAGTLSGGLHRITFALRKLGRAREADAHDARRVLLARARA